MPPSPYLNYPPTTHPTSPPHQSELDREQAHKHDDASAWVVQARQLEAEGDWATAMADALAVKNKALVAANSLLQRQHASGDADRAYLLEQLVAVKKDNAALSMQATAVKSVHKLAEKWQL